MSSPGRAATRSSFWCRPPVRYRRLAGTVRYHTVGSRHDSGTRHRATRVAAADALVPSAGSGDTVRMAKPAGIGLARGTRPRKFGVPAGRTRRLSDAPPACRSKSFVKLNFIPISDAERRFLLCGLANIARTAEAVLHHPARGSDIAPRGTASSLSRASLAFAIHCARVSSATARSASHPSPVNVGCSIGAVECSLRVLTRPSGPAVIAGIPDPILGRFLLGGKFGPESTIWLNSSY